MVIGAGRRFIRDRRGGVGVEFVALLPAFLFLTFFVLETAIAVLWVGTVEKAAQLGARLAIVSNFAVNGLAPTDKNQLAMNAVPGQNCPAACTAFTTRTCTGGTGGDCNTTNCLGATVPCFTVIVNRMRGIASVIQPANVTISYTYVGLGFAGGPIVPRVTVTIGRVGDAGQAVSYNTFTSSILGALMMAATGRNDFPGLTTMPPITATFTGEDLSTAGAS